MKNTHKNILIVVGALIAFAGVAAASSYITTEHNKTQTKVANAPKTHSQKPQQMAAATPACDDGNIVGTIAGGAAGGIIGSQVGKGSGKTAATIGGTLGGAYVGNAIIPTRNVTCR